MKKALAYAALLALALAVPATAERFHPSAEVPIFEAARDYIEHVLPEKPLVVPA